MPSSRAPEITKKNRVTVIALGPEYDSLDELGLDDLKDVMLDVSQTADPPLVVLDLSHTKFFGSAFIEILFRTWNRLNARDGGRFAISGLTEYCKEVIEVTHLNRLWEFFDTCDDAIAALSGD